MHDKSNTVNSQQVDDEIDLLELIYTILAGKWRILFYTTLSFLFAFIYAYGQTPVYKADALLQVEAKQASIPGIEELAGFGGDDISVGAELEIIKSRKNLGQAVETLHLDILARPKRVPLLSNFFEHFFSSDEPKKPPLMWDRFDTLAHQYSWGNEKIKVTRLNVGKELLNKSLTLVIKEKKTFAVYTKQNKFLLKGRVGQPSSSKNGLINLFVSELTGLPGTEFIITKLSELRTIEGILKKVKASEKGKKTGIISLSLEGGNKKTIVDILDQISKTYLEQNKSRSSEEASNALKFLEEQIKPVQENSDKTEALLKRYRTQNQTADMSKETQAVLDVVANLDTELQKLSLKKDELGQKYTINHPTIQAISTQERRLRKRKEKTLKKISLLPDTQQKLLKLERDFKVSNTIYIDLLNNIQEFKIAKASSVGNVYIVDTAVVHDKPIKPKKPIILALGLLLGAMLGVLSVFIQKALHRTVHNPGALEETTGIPVYATIPFSQEVKLTGGIRAKNRRQKKLLATEDSTDPAIESLRSLRTSLHFALLESKNNIVMITGPSPGIGKSFVASNFAAVTANSEQRVLLIDADMRKGYLHSLFSKRISPGLSDLISEKSTLEEVMHTIKVGNNSMDFISRGKTPPNPSELLMHSNFKKVLSFLSKQYDLILIDTPPVHAVTDPSIIGTHAGVVFMVVYSEYHSMKEIEHSVKRLSQTGIKTKGFIFNGYVKKSGYGYEEYGYQAYYGDYKSDNK